VKQRNEQPLCTNLGDLLREKGLVPPTSDEKVVESQSADETQDGFDQARDPQNRDRDAATV
jgi:hypothetical protein